MGCSHTQRPLFHCLGKHIWLFESILGFHERLHLINSPYAPRALFGLKRKLPRLNCQKGGDDEERIKTIALLNCLISEAIPLPQSKEVWLHKLKELEWTASNQSSQFNRMVALAAFIGSSYNV